MLARYQCQGRGLFRVAGLAVKFNERFQIRSGPPRSCFHTLSVITITYLAITLIYVSLIASVIGPVQHRAIKTIIRIDVVLNDYFELESID